MKDKDTTPRIEYKLIHGVHYTYDYGNRTITHYTEHVGDNGFVYRMPIIDFMPDSW